MTFEQITAAVDTAASELLARAEIPGARFARGQAAGGNVDPHLTAFFDLPDHLWGALEHRGKGQYTIRVYARTDDDDSTMIASGSATDLASAVKAVFP